MAAGQVRPVALSGRAAALRAVPSAPPLNPWDRSAWGAWVSPPTVCVVVERGRVEHRCASSVPSVRVYQQLLRENGPLLEFTHKYGEERKCITPSSIYSLFLCVYAICLSNCKGHSPPRWKTWEEV